MSQNLAKIFLDTSLIELAIKNYDVNADVAGPTDRKSFVEYVLTQSGAKPATIHVYSRQDGTTTLNTKVGTNHELSQMVGEHVAAACKKKEFKQRQLGLASISTSHWQALLSHLSTEYNFVVTEESVQHGVRFRVKKGPGDEVNLHRYSTGTFLMQGKCREVYGAVAAALCALLPNKRELVDAQLKSLDLDNIKASDLMSELSARVPSAIDLLADVGAAIIAPSLAITKVTIDLPDYSLFAYPALRGLEVYMKAILAKFGYTVKNEVGFADCFVGSTTLKMSIRNAMNSQSTCEAVEVCYALYNKHRHGLFHADANPAFSRTIDTQAEAAALVNEVLFTIEHTASDIKK